MKIGIVQRKDNKLSPEKVSSLIASLASLGADVIVPAALREFYAGYAVTFADGALDLASPDVIFVLGGDGSFISAARNYSDIPIIGINFGTLAYMAELEYAETEYFEKLVKGEYEVEERMMLDATVRRGEDVISLTRPAFNDVVLSNGPLPHVITFDMILDGVAAQSYKSDGIIIATPSGSTAYSMSAGGPVLDPSIECIVATPICPHAIGQRPVVLSSSVEIRFENVRWRKDNVYLSADGDEVIELGPGDIVTIRRSKKNAKLAHVKNSQFLRVLCEKMGDSKNNILN